MIIENDEKSNRQTVNFFYLFAFATLVILMWWRNTLVLFIYHIFVWFFERSIIFICWQLFVCLCVYLSYLPRSHYYYLIKWAKTAPLYFFRKSISLSQVKETWFIILFFWKSRTVGFFKCSKKSNYLHASLCTHALRTIIIAYIMRHHDMNTSCL